MVLAFSEATNVAMIGAMATVAVSIVTVIGTLLTRREVRQTKHEVRLGNLVANDVSAAVNQSIEDVEDGRHLREIVKGIDHKLDDHLSWHRGAEDMASRRTYMGRRP